MTIFTISDIHGSYHYLKKALTAFEAAEADLLLILGDQLYHGPRNPLPEDYNPKIVAETLNKYRDKIVAVRGNCDSEVDQMVLDYPITSDLSTVFWNNKRIVATHGHIYNEDKLPPLSSGDILISGHTHLPLAKKEGDITILNPGSISIPKGGYPNTYGVFKDNAFQVISFEGEVIKEIVFD